MFDPQEDGAAVFGVRLELVEAPCGVAVSEVPSPAGKNPVEPANDRLHNESGQGTGGEFAYPLASTGHCPSRWSPGQEPQVASRGLGPPMMESEEVEAVPVREIHDAGLVGM